MKLNEVTALALRILGVYLFVRALSSSLWYVLEVQRMSDNTYGAGETNIYWAVAATGSLILCAWLLVKFPLLVANKITPKSLKDSPIINVNGEALQIAGFTILGVYILSWSVPDLLYNFLFIAEIHKYNPSDDRAMFEQVSNQVVTVIEIGVGAYLTVRAKGLNKLIVKLRS